MPGPGKKEDVAFRNVVLCTRPGNQFPSDEEARECLRRHQKELFAQAVEGPAMATPWVSYGANATRVLTGVELPPTKTRGTFLPLDTRLKPNPFLTTSGSKWLVSSLHPAFLVRGGGRDNPGEQEGKSQDELKPLLGADARRAIEANDSGPRIPTVSFLQSPDGLAIPSPGTIVSVDIEGANGRPNIVGVSWNEDEAFVFPWSEELRLWLTGLFETNIPTFHNAAYDVPELELAGVVPPKLWWDTINMAALYDPDQPMNLQTQVLTHVLGSVAWKGLINHEKGPDFDGGPVDTYRKLWTRVLSAMEMPVPVTGTDWYAFYNGLDTAWGLALAKSFERRLTSQGRWAYYTDVMMPLQRPLLEIGSRGMPVDEAKVAEHREMCKAKVAEATQVLVESGQEMIDNRNATIVENIMFLEGEKIREVGVKGKGFTRKEELAKLKTKLKPKKSKNKQGEVKIKDPHQFDPSSPLQKAALLYDWYGLPPVKNKGAKGPTTDETAVSDLLSRIQRGTIKPKRGTPEEVAQVLQAIMDVGAWGVLISTFLQPELK